MYDLLIQRVITPGFDGNQHSWPNFRLTGYGREVAAHRGAIPHDPAGYLGELRKAAPTLVDDTCVYYVEEALACFTSGRHTASALLLGVAAEQLVLNLVSIGIDALKNTKEAANATTKAKGIAGKHRWICEKLRGLPKTELGLLPDQLDINVASLYCMIRRQRNELGHPQEQPPSVGRNDAFALFTVFPVLARDAEVLAEYCRVNGW